MNDFGIEGLVEQQCRTFGHKDARIAVFAVVAFESVPQNTALGVRAGGENERA